MWKEPPMQITGLDPSLTGTGIARLVISPEMSHILDVTTVTSTGSREADYAQRCQRLDDIADQIGQHAYPTDLVVMEGPSYGHSNPGTWDRAGLWWALYRAAALRCPVAVLPPNTLKRYATGKGNATKADMRVALIARADRDLRDDNQVDAAWLAYAGSSRLGLEVIRLPKAHRVALDGGYWPGAVDSRAIGAGA